jgi:hypothetical protein
MDTITLTPDQLALVALSAMRAVCGDDRYQYLSGPITGGPRLLDWHTATGRNLPDDLRSSSRARAVTKVNIAELIVEGERQRGARRRTIEPASFEAEVEGWGQPQFYTFWNEVIRCHADRVVFVPGWEYSVGCTFEYLCARRQSLPTFELDGLALAPDRATALIDAALTRIAGAHDPADPRDEVVARLYTGIYRYRHEIAAL